MQPKVICLIGPTASGKTDLSLRLAEDFPCEIVSVDSAMIYKTMDIGTAKPSLSQRGQVTHHLIDMIDPLQAYSAAKFTEDAQSLIHSIQARGKMPLLVGGTMLYFKALQQGLSLLPPANTAVRDNLALEAECIGWQEMHTRLAAVDPESAKRISPNDPQRIQRALEVFKLTGQPLSHLWRSQEKYQLPFDCINIALSPQDRTTIHHRIAHRFEKMIEEGLIEEVEMLYRRGDLHINLPSMRCVGYRQVWQYLSGQINYPEMCDKAVAATRQLAKRQLSWLRHWEEITWFDSMDPKVYNALHDYIKNLNTLN